MAINVGRTEDVKRESTMDAKQSNENCAMPANAEDAKQSSENYARPVNAVRERLGSAMNGVEIVSAAR